MYRFYVNCENWKPTHDQWIYATRCIQPVEVERIDRFVFQRDAKFALVGQLLTRYLLSRAFERPSSSFVIQRTDRGRPFVDVDRKFDFNYSHHNQLVCIAGTFDGRVGCDTMEYRVNRAPREPIESTTTLLRDQFTRDEYNFIVNQTKDEKLRFCYFHRLWSLKESYVKWLGYGIGFTLSRINFCVKTKDFDQDNTQQVLSDTKLELDNMPSVEKLRFDEQIVYLPDNEQQIIALCLSETNVCQPFLELTIDEVLQGCTPLEENIQDQEKWWTSFQIKKLK